MSQPSPTQPAPAQPEAWTIGRLLVWTADYLKRQGSESPRLDAELLLAHSLTCQRIELYTQYDVVVDEPTRARFRDLVKQRAEGMPVAYLLGRREFYSLNFHVSPDVLIPRPETEFAVIAVLDRLKERAGDATPARIVDVGTGSGAIAVTVAKHAPQAEVTAIDISPTALAIAQRNAEENQVAERIRFVAGDLLADLPGQEQFDIVVSNPPYVSESEFAELSPEVARYEPRQALVAGEQGTEVIARLIPQAAERLVAGGWLMMEISPMIAEAVVQLLAADDRFEPAAVMKDLAGRQRIIQARRK
jgi:release factor glutamine methyltransferase